MPIALAMRIATAHADLAKWIVFASRRRSNLEASRNDRSSQHPANGKAAGLLMRAAANNRDRIGSGLLGHHQALSLGLHLVDGVGDGDHFLGGDLPDHLVGAGIDDRDDGSPRRLIHRELQVAGL